MQGLTEDRVIDTEITSQCMNGWPFWALEARGGLLDVVESGQHRAGITGIAHG
jgi:hypothetical protein